MKTKTTAASEVKWLKSLQAAKVLCPRIKAIDLDFGPPQKAGAR
jgi:hypothetical protein